MTDKQLKLIYEYMGWFPCPEIGQPTHHPLDSNHAWECVQEMERRGDWKNFIRYVFDVYTIEGDEESVLMGMTTCLRILNTITYPDNFFTSLVEWLEHRKQKLEYNEKYNERTVGTRLAK